MSVPVHCGDGCTHINGMMSACEYAKTAFINTMKDLGMDKDTSEGIAIRFELALLREIIYHIRTGCDDRKSNDSDLLLG